MLTTSTRLLRLLALLQSQRDWTGAELATRLGVTARTVRNDIERLRTLGYQVDAARGAAGGYRLGVGTALPPLLLDEEEAVAVAIGLFHAGAGTIAGVEEASRRALVKLEQVLPSRSRHRVDTLRSAMAPVPGPEPTVDPDTLVAIAAAVRDHRQLRLRYVSHDGAASLRVTEPHWLAHTGHRWYLVAWDIDRAAWRTFRVDRLTPRIPTGPRFTPRDPPHGSVADFLAASIGAAKMRYRARVLVHAPAATITPWLPAEVQVSPIDDQTCEVAAGSDSPQMLAAYLALLEVDFEIIDPPDFLEHLRTVADRFQRATTLRAPADRA